jgi:hypothetical protein
MVIIPSCWLTKKMIITSILAATGGCGKTLSLNIESENVKNLRRMFAERCENVDCDYRKCVCWKME